MNASFCQVLTAPHMEHGTQWAGRGQSSARMLPPNLLTPASTHSPSSVFSSFFPSLYSNHQKEKYIHAGFWLAACLFGPFQFKGLISSLPCSDHKAGHLHRLRMVCLSRHTEPNLHHTGGVKGINYGPVQQKKRKMKQHKNTERRGMGEKVQGKKTKHQSP